MSTQERPLVVDAYSGPGGVGLALDSLDVRHVGVDIQDYSDTYPGEFVRADASDVAFMSRFPSPSLLWLSPKCQAYSKLSYANAGRYDWDRTPKEKYPTFDDLNVRAVVDAINPDHYVIENVATCDDLREPTRLNGLAFGLPIVNERHFETSFPVPDALGSGKPDFQIGSDYVRHELAAAKDVPPEWTESEIRSAIPQEFVYYLLHHCPSVPDVPLPGGLESHQSRLTDQFVPATDGGTPLQNGGDGRGR
ncbi:hypothetical protein IL252_15350 [Halomicrobium sp. IBSBa]|uniref:hypothetical protein n=1 Tax=Halomicrobium sp. IBSBa TaxID=2778916 RepID=UPI001ABFE6B6|nr:hypothetical protein [Halomicrobium sp. IBSBa]MBO4249193.1 hypothetical protein [Halomicrobium sp. IBSBa]